MLCDDLLQDIGEFLQSVGHEVGVTTGRKRRCGWLDIPLLRFTALVNGYTAIALTKTDILDTLKEIKIGVEYIKNGKEMDHFPSSEQVRKKSSLFLLLNLAASVQVNEKVHE